MAAKVGVGVCLKDKTDLLVSAAAVDVTIDSEPGRGKVKGRGDGVDCGGGSPVNGVATLVGSSNEEVVALCSAELAVDVLAALDSNKGFGAICGAFSASRVATSENGKLGVACFSCRAEGAPKASGRLEDALALVELVNAIFPSVALSSENGEGAEFCSSDLRKGKSPVTEFFSITRMEARADSLSSLGLPNVNDAGGVSGLLKGGNKGVESEPAKMLRVESLFFPSRNGLGSESRADFSNFVVEIDAEGEIVAVLLAVNEALKFNTGRGGGINCSFSTCEVAKKFGTVVLLVDKVVAGVVAGIEVGFWKLNDGKGVVLLGSTEVVPKIGTDDKG